MHTFRLPYRRFEISRGFLRVSLNTSYVDSRGLSINILVLISLHLIGELLMCFLIGSSTPRWAPFGNPRLWGIVFPVFEACVPCSVRGSGVWGLGLLFSGLCFVDIWRALYFYALSTRRRRRRLIEICPLSQRVHCSPASVSVSVSVSVAISVSVAVSVSESI